MEERHEKALIRKKAFVKNVLKKVKHILLCFALLKTKKDSFDLQKAKRVFGYSIFYLFFIFVLFLIDKLF